MRPRVAVPAFPHARGSPYRTLWKEAGVLAPAKLHNLGVRRQAERVRRQAERVRRQAGELVRRV